MVTTDNFPSVPDVDPDTQAQTGTDSLDPAASSALISRLSLLPDGILALPSCMSDEGASHEQVQQHLQALLARDPAVFLERYGTLLIPDEVALFEPLRHNYEVNHYVQALVQHQASNADGPVGSTAASRPSATAHNRRYALMRRLQQDGTFFSEDSMRERAPLLWQQLVGRYEQERPLPQPGAGEVLSEGLLRSHDEVQLRARLQAEQEAAGTLDEEAGDDGDWQQEGHEERVQELAAVMQARFMAGKELSEYVDYARVDADASLDEDWAAQQTQDAEDRWFDAD